MKFYMGMFEQYFPERLRFNLLRPAASNVYYPCFRIVLLQCQIFSFQYSVKNTGVFLILQNPLLNLNVLLIKRDFIKFIGMHYLEIISLIAGMIQTECYMSRELTMSSKQYLFCVDNG